MYVDADFASKVTDRKSVSGAMVFVAAMLVVWISRTQKCVSQSTSEAEYLAMGDGVKEALFVNGVLQFLGAGGYRKPHKIDVLEENEGAIAPAENPLSSSRSKHIDVRHHFLGNLTEEGMIDDTHVPSENSMRTSSRRLCREIFLKFTATLHLARGMRSRSLRSFFFFFFFDIYFWSDRYTAPREGVRDSGRVYRLSCGRTSDWMI